jgi:hypothetical protein
MTELDSGIGYTLDRLLSSMVFPVPKDGFWDVGPSCHKQHTLL